MLEANIARLVFNWDDTGIIGGDTSGRGDEDHSISGILNVSDDDGNNPPEGSNGNCIEDEVVCGCIDLTKCNSNSEANYDETKDKFDLKQEVFKYLYFWKYFFASVMLLLFLAFVYNKYSPKIYSTSAKIQILDKKESALNLPSATDLFSNSKINLENELEVIKSYPILEQVVRNQKMRYWVSGVISSGIKLHMIYPSNNL